jgi:hypothetical protein
LTVFADNHAFFKVNVDRMTPTTTRSELPYLTGAISGITSFCRTLRQLNRCRQTSCVSCQPTAVVSFNRPGSNIRSGRATKMKLTTTRVLNRRNIFSVVSIPWHFCHAFFARLKISRVHTKVSTVVRHNIKLQELTNHRITVDPRCYAI